METRARGKGEKCIHVLNCFFVCGREVGAGEVGQSHSSWAWYGGRHVGTSGGTGIGGQALAGSSDEGTNPTLATKARIGQNSFSAGGSTALRNLGASAKRRRAVAKRIRLFGSRVQTGVGDPSTVENPRRHVWRKDGHSTVSQVPQPRYGFFCHSDAFRRRAYFVPTLLQYLQAQLEVSLSGSLGTTRSRVFHTKWVKSYKCVNFCVSFPTSPSVDMSSVMWCPNLVFWDLPCPGIVSHDSDLPFPLMCAATCT